MLKYAFALMLAAGPAMAQPAPMSPAPNTYNEVGAFWHDAVHDVPPASAPAVSQVPPPASDSAISAIWVGPIVSITPQGAVKIYRWPGKPLECGLECGPTDISPVPMPPTRLTVSLAQALSAALADNERLRQEIEMLHRHVEVLTDANASMVDYVNLAGRYCPRPPK